MLCRRATQPQCSSSSTKILSKFCENFNIPLILTNSDGSVNNFLWRSFKFDSNILPIFCITHENDSDYCRCILYKIHLLLEPLKTLNLFPHYGVSSASQVRRFAWLHSSHSTVYFLCSDFIYNHRLFLDF